MQIKRFEAKNMTEALRQIKRELGPEAVILSAKDIRKENSLLGISRKVGVEVTAAVDGGLPVSAPSHQGRLKNRGMARSERRSTAGIAAMGGGPNAVEDVVAIRSIATVPNNDLSGQATQMNRPSGGRASQPSGAATRFHSGFRAGPTGPAADQSTSPAPIEDWQQQLHQRLQDGGLAITPWPFKSNEIHIVALVGSAGVGKTTTIAKLAAQLQYEHGLRVGMIALDQNKIGAVEQLQIYAEILQIPLEIPRSDRAWQQAIKALRKCNVVLVDTPALGVHRENRPAVFDERLRPMANLETWLVIGADTQVACMQSAAALSSDLDPCAVVVTKTDMSGNLEGVMEFLSLTSLPLVGLTNGPRVPGDLCAASYDRFARLLLRDGRRAESLTRKVSDDKARRTQDQYLANRSSDIFHRPDCKWIRLINKENIVMFGSFAEALNNRFKPCRYCNPQHMSITGILHQEGAVH
jgi:flagellar biosynthesis protein FlhF